MSTTMILICKEDIITSKIGCNFNVKTAGGVILNFTGEALKELVGDYLELTSDELNKKGASE